ITCAAEAATSSTTPRTTPSCCCRSRRTSERPRSAGRPSQEPADRRDRDRIRDAVEDARRTPDVERTVVRNEQVFLWNLAQSRTESVIGLRRCAGREAHPLQLPGIAAHGEDHAAT